MIYFTSDLHLFHKSILTFESTNRPYSNVDEMNSALIDKWNNLILPEDKTYIIGDVSFGNVNETIRILDQLNGEKILIVGNHDKYLIMETKFIKCFSEVHHYHELKYNGIKICMFHYPILMWNQKHHGSFHLHGHLHSNKSGIEGRIKNVGWDATGKIAVSLDEIYNELVMIDFFNHNHH